MFGRCVNHWLEQWRYEHQGTRVSATLDLSNINRPYLMVDDSRPVEWVALSFGNGNSDPVWSVTLSRKTRS